MADLPYAAPTGPQPGPDHLLDVWRPRAPREAGTLLPLLVYVHGGGFGFCSKQTHWLVAASLAARGFCVVNVNYRRVPRHPFPAALEDVAQAIAYSVTNARRWQADPNALVLMGESAGANLVLAQALAAGLPPERAPAFVAPLHRAGAVVRALLPACGLLDVHRPQRLGKVTGAALAPAYVQRRIAAVCRSYAPPRLAAVVAANPSGADAAQPWASPLAVLERATSPWPVLPPTWIGVGDQDPIAEDSARLHAALQRGGHVSTLVRYPGRGHAFFALPKGCGEATFWQQAATFIGEALGPPHGP